MSAEDAQNAAAMEEEVPTLEAAEVPQVGKQSKRHAKRMAKMGLKPEPNVTKVNIRKVGTLSFSIGQPEVYRFPGTNTFVIFGEAQLEDPGMLPQDAEARAATVISQAIDAATAGTSEAEAAASTMEVEDSDVDATDLDEKEINVVMTQANVSRAKAIRAMKNNNGDIVNAIMDLTL